MPAARAAPSADDRREFFRIDDSIRVSVRRVDQAEMDAHNGHPGDHASGFNALASLAAISSQSAAILRRIDERSPDIAAYLRVLDEKIELIGRVVVSQQSEALAPTQSPVNLSAGGLGVDVDEPYETGELVEVRMLLHPSFTGLATYGTVLGCDANDDSAPGKYHLRVTFDNMSEPDRDVLVRHILRRQSEQLRANRHLD